MASRISRQCFRTPLRPVLGLRWWSGSGGPQRVGAIGVELPASYGRPAAKGGPIPSRGAWSSFPGTASTAPDPGAAAVQGQLVNLLLASDARSRGSLGAGSLLCVGAGATLFSLLCGGCDRWVCCDTGASESEGIRFVTYNVLSPPLAEQKGQFPKCEPTALRREDRLPRVLQKLEPHIHAGSIIALQEVALEWVGKLHTVFSQHNYTLVYCQYGNELSGYMGVALAWPNHLYEALDVELCRLSDTPPREVWDKTIERRQPDSLNRFGFLTEKGLRDIIGCRPPEVAWGAGASTQGADWALARNRKNELPIARLRHRSGGEPFCVACYHMPCLFGPPEKVRTRNIHALLMMAKVYEFARGDPCIFMGDFNWNPRDSSYSLLEKGGNIAAVASESDRFREEVRGLGPAAELVGQFAPSGSGRLQSAYRSFHGSEPGFTNFACSQQNPPFCETLDYILFSEGRFRVLACPELPAKPPNGVASYPTVQEPSDHVLLAATLSTRAKL